MAKGTDPESGQIARRLKAFRIELGHEVDDVAERMGISPPSWYAYERGLTTFPYTKIPAVARALGVSTDDLYGRLFPAEPVKSSFSAWGQGLLSALVSRPQAFVAP